MEGSRGLVLEVSWEEGQSINDWLMMGTAELLWGGDSCWDCVGYWVTREKSRLPLLCIGVQMTSLSSMTSWSSLASSLATLLLASSSSSNCSKESGDLVLVSFSFCGGLVELFDVLTASSTICILESCPSILISISLLIENNQSVNTITLPLSKFE